jgi:hypothetical protein
MKHTVDLNSRQLEIIRDLLEERIEDLNGDISHYEIHPEELSELTEPGEEPLSVEDYEHYRDEVQTLLSVIQAAEA